MLRNFLLFDTRTHALRQKAFNFAGILFFKAVCRAEPICDRILENHPYGHA